MDNTAQEEYRCVFDWLRFTRNHALHKERKGYQQIWKIELEPSHSGHGNKIRTSIAKKKTDISTTWTGCPVMIYMSASRRKSQNFCLLLQLVFHE
jgi:hypothetical protein